MGKTIELGYTKSNDLIKIESAFEVGLSATENLQSLAFFIGNLDFNRIDEYETEDLQIYFEKIGELVGMFSGEALNMLQLLEDSRQSKSKVVKK